MRYDYRYGVLGGLMAIVFGLGGCFGRVGEESVQQGGATEISFDTHPTREVLVVSAPCLGGRDLYLVDLSTLQVQRLTRTNDLDEDTPRFSPDGQAVVHAARPPRANPRERAILHGGGAMSKNNPLPPDHDLPADLQQSVKKALAATDDLRPPPCYDAAYWREERGALLEGLVASASEKLGFWLEKGLI